MWITIAPFVTTTLSDEIERKIIRLFALGMSYQDISREIEDLYAFSVSTATISAVTDKVIPELKQWQQRPLEKVYPFVWLDAILNRPGFPGECFICELRLPDHRFRWKHNKLFLLLPEEYGPAFPAIVDCYTSPPT
ncbi:hypothetical protein QMY51_04879 (plasmid) [Escherichia coli]|nr:hypothetical protein QMY51_04879 [Escherichia coli]